MATPLLELTNATKSLPDGTPLLRDVSFLLHAGQSMSLTGRSGSGKSTLLAAIGLMDRLNSGTLAIRGVETSTANTTARDRIRGEMIGFVFQRFVLIPHISILENVMAPLRHGSPLKRNKMKARALETLEAVDMVRHARKRPHQLSGGEQQRVAIARALAKRPALILADEPTGSLDEENGSAVMSLLLQTVRSLEAGLIVVTHDLEIASMTDTVHHLESGTLHRPGLAHRGLHRATRGPDA